MLATSSGYYFWSPKVGPVSSLYYSGRNDRSIYFDNNSALNVPASSGLAFSGDFTFEFWVYFLSHTSPYIIDSNTAGQFGVRLNGNGTVEVFTTTTSGTVTVTTYTLTNSLSTNRWYHFAFVRISNLLALYINGVRATTSFSVATVSTSYTAAGTFVIGAKATTSARSNFLYGYLTNLRVHNTIGLYTGRFAVPSLPFDSFSIGSANTISSATTNCSLLIARTSTDFVDSSPSALSITANTGTPTSVGYATPFFSPGYGNNGYDNFLNFDQGIGIDFPDSEAFNFQTNGNPNDSFTIEFFVRWKTTVSTTVFFQQTNSSGAVPKWTFMYNHDAYDANYPATSLLLNGYDDSSTYRTWLNTNSTTAGVVWAPVADTWYHIALTRTTKASNGIRVFVDGVLKGTGTAFTGSDGTTTSLPSSTGVLQINKCDDPGRSTPSSGTWSPNIYMTGIRFAKCVLPNYITASTTAGTTIFTRPNSPAGNTANANVVFQYTGTGTYSDNDNDQGPYKLVPNTVGFGTKIVALPPVSPYFPDWGCYFPNTGYINLTKGVGNGPSSWTTFSGVFTIEFWINAVSMVSNSTILGNDTNGALQVYYSSGGTLSLNIYGSGDITGTVTSTSFTLGTWYHVAICRNSSNILRIFVNGTAVVTPTISSAWTASTNYRINQGGHTANIAGVRITNTAVYDSSSITIPTTLPTNISGTQLLICDNANLVDSSNNAAVVALSGSPVATRFNLFR